MTKLRKKLSSRNNLLESLANVSWGADAETLRQTAVALCYSTAEFCAAVWARSFHTQRVDPELNRACWTITGTLKATPLPAFNRLSGIPPPGIRREAIAEAERDKQLSDPRHPLYGHQEVRRRLKSRRSFATLSGLTAQGFNGAPSYRLSKWREKDGENPNQALPTRHHRTPVTRQGTL